MRSIRRFSTAALGASLLLGVTAPALPAVAHMCSTPVAVDVGSSATITIGVTNDGPAPVTNVVVSVPDGFVVETVAGAPGWTAERAAAAMTFAGGAIETGACGLFTITGAARRRGVLAFPIRTTASDGAVTVFEGRDVSDPKPAQLVFAGTEPPEPGEEPPDDPADAGDGTSAVPFVLGGLVALGLAALGAGVLGKRRAEKRRAAARAAARARPRRRRR